MLCCIDSLWGGESSCAHSAFLYKGALYVVIKLIVVRMSKTAFRVCLMALRVNTSAGLYKGIIYLLCFALDRFIVQCTGYVM